MRKPLNERASHAIFEVVESGGKKRPRITTPQMTLRVTSKEELQAQLQHYSRANGATFLRHVLPDSKEARLEYIERTRPALRHYCEKFKVDAPEWLKSDVDYSTLPKHSQLELFGKVIKFPVREFTPIKFPSQSKKEEQPDGSDRRSA